MCPNNKIYTIFVLDPWPIQEDSIFSDEFFESPSELIIEAARFGRGSVLVLLIPNLFHLELPPT